MITPYISLLSDIALGAVIIFLVIAFFDVYGAYQKERQLYGLAVMNKHKKDIIRNTKVLKQLNIVITRFYKERKKEQFTALTFYVILLGSVALFLYFIFMKQLLLAILAPLTVLWLSKKVFSLLSTDENSKIDEQLPHVIDTIIKVFSRYGDLKSVFYETSQSIDEPMKGYMESLARKMLSSDHEEALMEFADELDNIWVYSMVFIILSYREETKKEEVILNLKHLSSILEKENGLKNTSVTDKRYGVVLNYVIMVFAFLGSIANIVFNPAGKEFFFGSIGGIFTFIIGYASLIITLLINIKLTSKKRKE